MNATLYNGYSGVMTQQFGIDSTSNNISNINTTAYKGNVPLFSSVFATSLDTLNANSAVSNDFEYGATTASNAIDMSEGSLKEADGSPFNMAVAGDGWFVVGQAGLSTTIGEDEITAGVYYTRDGSFSLNSEAYLVNDDGYYVYGIDLGKIDPDDGTFTMTNDTDTDTELLSGATLEPLQIPQEISAMPLATEYANLSLNLSREDNLAAVDSLFVDEDGGFDQEAFLQNDMNTLFISSGEHLDLAKNNEFTITIRDKDSDGNYSDSSETISATIQYGETDDPENGIFHTVGGFLEAIETQTEGRINAEFNANDSCEFTFSNATEENYEVTMGADNELFDLLGVTEAPTELYADNEGSIISSSSLTVPHYKTNMTVYDDEGTAYLMQTVYTLTDYGTDSDDTWNVSTQIYEKSTDALVSESPATGTLQFQSDGSTPVFTGNSEVEFVNGMTISVDYTGAEGQQTTNRLYKDSSVVDSDINGNPPGQLEDISIDENGIITLHFSNNLSEPMGRIGLAGFVNEQGLSKMGDNLFQLVEHTMADGESKIVSGAPMLMWNSSTNNPNDPYQGTLKSSQILQGYLETSNVDMATALTELIVMQRAYSASAKSLTTGDEMIQEAIQMKRS